METLEQAGRRTEVACEAAYLAGVLAAARAGLGATVLATLGETPSGLVPVPEPTGPGDAADERPRA